MEFFNRQNKLHFVIENNLFYSFLMWIFKWAFKKRAVWESRSVAVNCVVLVTLDDGTGPFILISRRGPNAADFKGKMNIVAGYLDWDESGTEAVLREAWEECGINLEELKGKNKVLADNLTDPWHVKTKPNENKQNVALRYGLKVKLSTNILPTLTTIHNEIPGEVETAQWVKEEEINHYEWAFNHDEVIKEYLRLL